MSRRASEWRLLRKGAGDGEGLLGGWADADVIGEVFPADDAGTIDEKFSGAGDIVPVHASALVQQVVAANDFGLRVTQKRERVTGLLAQIRGDIGGVHADGHGPHALRGELRKTLLNASQLEVAVRSPVTTIEDEENCFGRRSASGGGEKLREGGGVAGAVWQGEIRRALADLRRTSRARKFASADEKKRRGGHH